MTKEFTTYEQALALKELGFDEICLGMHIIGGLQLFSQRGFAISKGGYTNTDLKTDGVIGAPTFSQAFRWFRERHDMHHGIGFTGSWYYDIDSMKNCDEAVYEVAHKWDMETYEEAESACLDKLIEIVKNKENDNT